MSDSTAELTLIMRARDLASKEVDRLHQSLGRAKGSAGALGGAMLNLAKVGIFAVVAGATALVGALAFGAKQAASEQVGIVRLGAALKANIPHWKGNTDAIEALIAKRETLAFSDDELRGSLSTLVTKYRDVEKAQRVQQIAMDVARLKGISLADATNLVTKAGDGNAKMLKQLGLTLPKTATEQQRLTAIQKAAAGQADAYAKTSVGAQQAFKIALDDVIEDVGSGLLPIVTQAFTWLTTTGIPAIRGVITTIQRWVAQNQPLINQIRDFAQKVLAVLIARIKDVVTWLSGVFRAITSNKDAMNVLRTFAAKVGELFGLVVDAVSQAVSWFAQVFDTITRNKGVMSAFGHVWDVIGAAINVVVDALKWIVGNIGRVLGALGSIKLPDISGITNLIPHFAAGGYAAGPTLAVVGDTPGGEYMIPARQMGRMGGTPVTIPIMLDGREIARVVDERLYADLRRAAPTGGRI